MKKVLIFGLLVFMSAATISHAADKYWDGGSTNDRWLTAENWNNDALPAVGDRVFFDVAGDILVETGDYLNPRRILQQDSVVGVVTVTFTGGELLNTSYWYMGREIGGEAILNISGDTAITTRDLLLASGNGYAGTINITGGLLNINGTGAGVGAYFGSEPISGVTTLYTGSALVNISGGMLKIATFNTMGSNALIDISDDGKMVLSGDLTSVVDGYIQAGKIISSTGSLVVSTYEESGNTFTLVEVPEPATICLLGFGMFTLIRKK
ncbi:MAG: hypothetical protein A2Y10_01110 [Planctomycetes bacterium GWF2_41_51]|nr:MAG: hypothetical protein A2Y10_01110 [Planctomycetes bacterium GWF2_41_51]HBG26545.1 hypothetical protein [Phycisphaerales bacterium]